MKIAIDGPSASGKGTISKILSTKLGAIYLNTGKIYRIVALVASRQAGDVATNAIAVCQNIEKHFKEQEGNNEIYTEENAKVTSHIAKIPEVRKALLGFQQSFAQNNSDVILEGRDIGTVIMPNADYKFYLDASPEERAKRRAKQLNIPYSQDILNDIQSRDKNDSERSIAALTIPADAIYIDTTNKTIEETIQHMLDVINKK